MSMRMLIDARHPEETRVAVIQGNRIEEFDFESALREQLKGNIYLAKVTRVEPSLQAAFVEYGGNRHGFLAFSEIHPDYYQIPKEDRDALLRAEREAAEAHHAEMDARHADDEDDLGGEDNHEDERGEEHDDDHVDDRPAPSEVGEHDDHTTEAMRTKRQNLRRHYKIQEVIKRRQVLLVQVVKEERGNKGAALTTYLSLAGRYCVFMPNTNHGGGISRKISSQADRKRLKSIVSELKLPPGMGCIVRTAGLSRTKVEIKRDFDYLTRLWDEIRDRTLASSAPALIHEDSDLIKRAIRDIYNREIDDVVVDGAEGFKAARSFMKLLMPSHAKKVQQYVDPVPLFQRYQVEAQLAAMYHPVVQLKSGGYIVINPTEALVSIDINSGKSTREHNIEETALKTNIEAANEIARQLRLRDMAGLVVIDFIDMDFHGNNRKVERALKEALKNDRARIQLGRISTFGLLEMSRQRLRTGVLEASTHVCPVCDGAGIVRTLQSASLGALRVLEAEALKGKHSHITLRLPFEVAVYMLNVKRAQIANVEQLYGVTAEITPNGDLTIGEHEIDGGGPPPVARVDLALPVAAIIEDDDDVPEDEDEDEEVSEVVEKPRERGAERDAERTDESGRPRRRRGRGRGRGRDDNRPERIIEADREGESESVESEAPDAAQDGGEHAERDGGESEGSRRKRRRRGRRGGRRKPAEGQREDADEAGEAEPGEAVQADMPEAALIHADTGEAPRPRGRGRSKKPDSVAVEAAAVPIPDTAEPVTAEKPRASRRKAVDVAPKPDAARSDGAVIGIVAETVKPKVPRRKAAAKKSGDTGTVSASIDPARAANDAAGEDTGPPRKGWWQRTFGE